MPTAVTAPAEDCAECGFGWGRYSDEQAVGALILGGAFFRGALDGVDLELANARPADDTWSILEHVDHVRRSLAFWRVVVESAIAGESPGANVDLTPPRVDGVTVDPARFDDVEGTIAAMEAEGTETFSLFLGLDPAQWAVTGEVVPGVVDRHWVVDQHWVVRNVLHEILHHVHDAGRIRAQLGDGVPSQTGAVVQLNVSGGGVPKLPVDAALVTGDGMAGDHQNDRVHHGRPFQALCLYSLDVIEALNAEGHPIVAGAAGENVTVRNIDWAGLRPGTVLTIGDEVVVELSSYSTPCAKNAQWFADGYFRRMLHERHPGWSRLYATVLRPGRVRTGDAVIVEP